MIDIRMSLVNRLKRIDFIFVFLVFVIPVVSFFRQEEYMLSIFCLIVGLAFSKFRYNWVYLGEEYRKKVKKGIVKKRPLSKKLGWGHIEGTFLLAVFFTVFCLFCCFIGKFLFALISLGMALLFALFCYLFIKF